MNKHSKLRAIKDLTKDELLNLIYNNFDKGTVNIFDPLALCVCCGTYPDVAKTKYWYECDSCKKKNKKENKRFWQDIIKPKQFKLNKNCQHKFDDRIGGPCLKCGKTPPEIARGE